MAKHTLKEILGIFANGAGHTHEKAVSDVYDAGFDAGKAHATEQAGADTPAPAPAEGSSDEETQKAAQGEDTQADQTPKGETAST
jgi:hypothetical protein